MYKWCSVGCGSGGGGGGSVRSRCSRCRCCCLAAFAAAAAAAAYSAAARVTNEFFSHFSVEQTVFSSGLSKNQSRLSGQDPAVGHVGVARPHAGQSRHFGLSFPVQKHPALSVETNIFKGASFMHWSYEFAQHKNILQSPKII
jgi:hypothetical protein